MTTTKKPNPYKIPKESKVESKTESKMIKSFSDVYSTFDSLTPSQQEEFLRQIEYSKAKDHYANYLKICYPDMIFTKFHLFLCSLVETIVKQIEQGKNPRILLSVPPRHEIGRAS